MFGLTRRYTRRTRFVYSTCMPKVRTNIEIEDSYLQLVVDRYHLRTKTEAVDLALRHLAGQPMSREEALAMRAVVTQAEVSTRIMRHTVGSRRGLSRSRRQRW